MRVSELASFYDHFLVTLVLNFPMISNKRRKILHLRRYTLETRTDFAGFVIDGIEVLVLPTDTCTAAYDELENVLTNGHEDFFRAIREAYR